MYIFVLLGLVDQLATTPMHLVVVEQDCSDVLTHREIDDLVVLEGLMLDECGESGCLIHLDT